MRFTTTILPLLTTVLATVSAHNSTPRNTHSPNNPHSNTRRRCGAPEPDNDALDEADIDESSARVVNKFGQASDLNRQAKQMINVRTFVHVVTTTMSGVGKYSQAQIDMQLLAMNKAYNPHAISFTLANTSYTANDQWAYVSAESSEELQMKQALRRGSYGDLNLYFIEALGGDILGICSFPKNLQQSPGQNLDTLDGEFISILSRADHGLVGPG